MLRGMARLLYRRLAVGANVVYFSDLHVGPGTRVWASERLEIGRGVCTVEVTEAIGNGCLIANHAGVIGRRDHDLLKLGVPVSRSRGIRDRPAKTEDGVHIEDDEWIGFGAIVLPESTVGRGAVIAAWPQRDNGCAAPRPSGADEGRC
jgi:acetyltransferase-like isoleucine patch superfamily enzyme